MSRRFLIAVESPDTLTKKWRFIGVLIVLISLGFTLFFWCILTAANLNASQARLRAQTESTVDVLEKRITGFGDILYGMRSLEITNPDTTDQEWLAFVSTQNVYERYPGLGNIAYAEAWDDSGKPAAIITRLMKQETIPIVGLNLLDSPTVPDIFEDAVLSQAPTAMPVYDSPLPERSDSKDFIVILAFYDKILPREASDEAKKQAVFGYGIISVYPTRLFTSTFANIELPDAIAFQATDGDAVIYERGGIEEGTPKITRTSTIDVGGRQWTLHFEAENNYGLSEFEKLTPLLFVFGGITFMLLFVILYFYRKGFKIRVRV